MNKIIKTITDALKDWEPSKYCYCRCRNLNCTTLLSLNKFGGHTHYAYLPCPNNGKTPCNIEHEKGGGTCTCGEGPCCDCGYCTSCGRYDFGGAPLMKINE